MASEKGETEKAIMMKPWYSQTEKEILFYGNTDQIYCYDVQTGEMKPFCERSGCHHNTDECMSVRLAGETPLLASYRENLYYIDKDEITGKDSLFRINAKVKKSRFQEN